MNTLAVLKKADEDFEWYPTTDEILTCIRKDIFNIHKLEKYRYSHRSDTISFERTYKPEDNAKITIRFYYLKEHAQCE